MKRRVLTWSFATVVFAGMSYFGIGYAAFSDRYAVPLEARAFRFIVLADIVDKKGLNWEDSSTRLKELLKEQNVTMDENDHALKDLIIAGLSQKYNNRNLFPIPKWYHEGDDVWDGFQRRSWLHGMYPWLEKR